MLLNFYKLKTNITRYRDKLQKSIELRQYFSCLKCHIDSACQTYYEKQNVIPEDTDGDSDQVDVFQ